MAQGIPRTVINIPFGAGIDRNMDARARQPPGLDIARDVQFDEVGGVQTRHPFAVTGGNIFGGGTISNARKLFRNGDEFVLMTKDTLYSWNAQLSVWIARGTHLAVKVDERSASATTGDQFCGDRAELNGTIVFAWTEFVNAVSTVFAAAIDKTTGSVLVSPTAVSSSVARPRLVALSTKILLFTDDGSNNLMVRAIDPATPSTAISGSGTTVLATNYSSYYDVVKAGSQDLCVGACRRTSGTSYTVFSVTPALTVTAVTKIRATDGPFAVATIADGTKTQVIRANGTNIIGDYLTTSTLADVTTGQPVGTASGTVNQIAACYRSVQNSGAYRCYAFWSSDESSGTCSWLSKTNYVDTAGTIGTQATFVRQLGIGSRAFEYSGSIYVWLTFGGASSFSGSGSPIFSDVSLQNTYFLYRDDAFLAAKSLPAVGGGFSPITGWLPGVIQTSGSTIYSWCATKRRRVDLGGLGHLGFAAREPVDVTFEYDSNNARRTARIGKSLYIAAGEVLIYDGVRITECGFHVYPWTFGVVDAGGGSIAVGKYAYRVTYRYQNAQSEQDRSTTATTGTVTVAGSSTSIPTWAPLTATHKTAVAPAVEVWRTAVAPTADAPFYLVSSNDPASTSNPNRYITNDPTAASLPTFNDYLADASATVFETYDENGGVLENLAPPAASIIAATDTRLFLGGIPNDPDRVWYSKQRTDGRVASFHDALTIDIPPQGGDITAVALLNETLIVFREHAIYALPGSGLDNLGQGQNYGPANQLSADVGAVNAESVVLTPGGLFFKSAKGWYVLNRQFQAQYIGAKVAHFDSDTVLSVIVVELQHHIRCLTNNRMLVFDYVADEWAEWTISDGLHAATWNGVYHYLTSTGPKAEQSSYSALTYGIDLETSWIRPAELQGQSRLDWIMALGEYRSPHLLRVRIARDYKYLADDSPDWFDDTLWTVSPTVVAGPLQVRIGPSQQQCEAIKLRLTAVAEGVHATMATAGADLSPHVITSLGTWTATLSAVPLGEAGNNVTLSIVFESTTSTYSIDVRDHLIWDGTRWTELVNNVGVRVKFSVSSKPTIAQLEAAFSATGLFTVSVHDGTPTATLDVSMIGQTTTAQFSTGTYASPTGEALKLTGLGLEIGQRQGLFKQLPAAQKQ